MYTLWCTFGDEIEYKREKYYKYGSKHTGTHDMDRMQEYIWSQDLPIFQNKKRDRNMQWQKIECRATLCKRSLAVCALCTCSYNTQSKWTFFLCSSSFESNIFFFFSIPLAVLVSTIWVWVCRQWICSSAFASFRCPLHILVNVFHIFLLSLFPSLLASFVLLFFHGLLLSSYPSHWFSFCYIWCHSLVRRKKMEDNIIEGKEDIIDTRPIIFVKWNTFSICVAEQRPSQNDMGIDFIFV